MTQPVRGLGSYADRSDCGDVCSIETDVRPVLWCRLVNRIRVLLASLRRAYRNASMKKGAAPQALVNAIGPITSSSVPLLQSHESRFSSIRAQFIQNATRSHQICRSKFGSPVSSVKLFGRESRTKRVTEQYRALAEPHAGDVLGPTEGETAVRAAQFIYRRRASPGSEGTPFRSKPEGRRHAAEHAQIHGGAAPGLPARR